MTGLDADWPDPLVDRYELRATRQAMEDLRAAGLDASDLVGLASASPYGDIVDKFGKMRGLSPTGTEAPLSNVGRGDVYKLDGRDGQRAATWHDVAHGVVWLLALSPDHDFKELERRAASPSRKGLGGPSQLMPTLDDYEDLFAEREILLELRACGSWL